MSRTTTNRIAIRNTSNGSEHRVTLDLDCQPVGWACRFDGERTWQLFVIGCNQVTGEHCGTVTTKRDAVEWLSGFAARRAVLEVSQ